MVAFLSSITVYTICFFLDSCLAYSSTLTVEATYSSETSDDIQQPTRHCCCCFGRVLYYLTTPFSCKYFVIWIM
jgi:hypothetical protein